MLKNNFKIREDYTSVVNLLNNEQAGKLFKGLCAYVFVGNPFESTDRKVQAAFEIIKKHLDNEMRGRKLGLAYGRKGWQHAMENHQKAKENMENIFSGDAINNKEDK